MGGLLTQLGTALGGFVSGYDQERQQAQLRQFRQQQLQQQQKQQQAAGIAFQALQGGAIPGSTPGPGQLPQGMPMGGPQGGPGPPPQGGGGPGGPPPGPPRIPVTPSMPVSQLDRMSAQGNVPAGAASVRADVAAEGTAPAAAREPLPQQQGGGNDVVARERPGGDETRVGTSGGGPLPPPEQVQTNEQGRVMLTDGRGGSFDISQILHQTDPRQIAAMIHRARPDADPETAMLATERLFKIMNSGSKTEQMAALQLFKWMNPSANVEFQTASRERIAAGHEAGATERTGMTQAGATQREREHETAATGRTQTTQEGALTREREHEVAATGRTQMTQEGLDRRQATKIAASQANLQKRIDTSTQNQMWKQQATAANNAYKEINMQRAIIQTKIAGGSEDKNDRAQLKALSQQAVELHSKLAQMGLAIEGPAALVPPQ